MFTLDAVPDVEDADKLEYLQSALGSKLTAARSRQEEWAV
jgi:hypothetical protein